MKERLTDPEMAAAEPWKLIVMTVNGFTQKFHEGGHREIWRNNRQFVGRDTLIMTPIPWNSDPEEYARFVAQESDFKTHLIVIAYSWGAGWFFRRFQKHLDKRGVDIQHAVLCDPVVRRGLVPERLSKITPMSLWSILPFARMEIAPNVGRVSRFYQKQTVPKGHPLKIADPDHTVVELERELDASHINMEDQEEYQAHVHAVISRHINRIRNQTQ